MTTVACNHERRNELGTIDSHELNHCKKLLKGDHHCKHECRVATITKFIDSKDESLRESVAMNVSSILCAPLMLGKVQLGKVRNALRDLMLGEFHLRGDVVDPKEKSNCSQADVDEERAS